MSAMGIYEFGAFRLDPQERLLSRDDVPIQLAPKVFDTLVVLVESRGHLVTKEDLMQRLWPDAFVEENNLTQNISAIRRALADGNGKVQYVETVPKIGYRFVAPVRLSQPEVTNAENAAARSQPMSTATSGRRRHGPAIAVISSVLVVAGLGLMYIARDRGFRGPSSGAANAGSIRSIAVLPFSNLSSDPEQEYFSDGMTDELTTDLAKLTKLLVISHTSVNRYKQSKDPLPKIARELGVDAVVEGSVMRAGDRVRITAQLIDTRTDRHLWAESYERSLQDALALQSEVAEKIASEVGVKLTPAQRDNMMNARPANAAAQEAYLKGQFYWNRLNCAAFEKALNYFNQAVALDANYGAAYAGVARTNFTLADFGCRPQNQAFEQSRQAALKAIQSDPTLGSPHVWLGKIYDSFEWDWQKADDELRKAAELDANNAEAHLARAVFLIHMGRADDGFAELKRAHELDPMAEITSVIEIYAFYLAHRYDEAIEQGRKTVELYPASSTGYFWLAASYERKGANRDAVASYLKSKQLSGTRPEEAARWQLAFQRSGMRGYWEEELKQSVKSSDPCWSTMVYAHLGDKEHTLEGLERGLRDHCRGLNMLKVDPVFEPMYADARFQELLKQLRL